MQREQKNHPHRCTAEEHLLLIEILSHDLNFGYDVNKGWRTLTKLNGVPIATLKQLHEEYTKCSDAFLHFEFIDTSVITLSTKGARDAEAEICKEQRIESPFVLS